MTHDDDTISAREILALNGATPLIWEGKRIQYTSPEYAPGYHRTFEWVDYPAEPGTSVPMGTLGMREAGEFDTPTHVEIPVTLWGDYCGDDCGRSNFRSLTRDYPDTFVEVYDASGSHYLALPLDAEIYRGLFDEIKDVAENYPLYDESDHSEMEMEAVESAWDEFLSFDVARETDHGSEVGITRWSPEDAGCIFEGSRGWRISAEVIRLAWNCGMPHDADDVLIVESFENQTTVILSDGTKVGNGANDSQNAADFILDQGGMTDNAETWLNENVAPEGFAFGFHGGEFFLACTASAEDIAEDAPEHDCPREHGPRWSDCSVCDSTACETCGEPAEYHESR